MVWKLLQNASKFEDRVLMLPHCVQRKGAPYSHASHTLKGMWLARHTQCAHAVPGHPQNSGYATENYWIYYSEIMVLELEYKAWQLLQTSKKAKKGDTKFANSDFLQ